MFVIFLPRKKIEQQNFCCSLLFINLAKNLKYELQNSSAPDNLEKIEKLTKTVNVCLSRRTLFRAMVFESVNTCELPTCDCNHLKKCITTVHKTIQKSRKKVFRTSKVKIGKQTPILIHTNKKSFNFYNEDAWSFISTPLWLVEITGNYFLEHILWVVIEWVNQTGAVEVSIVLRKATGTRELNRVQTGVLGWGPLHGSIVITWFKSSRLGIFGTVRFVGTVRVLGTTRKYYPIV